MFEVGKKYQSVKTNRIYTCIFSNGEGSLIQSENREPIWWPITNSNNLVPYTPPPKKIKKEGWINIYRGRRASSIYPTEQLAKSNRSIYHSSGYITTKIEWEEEEKE